MNSSLLIVLLFGLLCATLGFANVMPSTGNTQLEVTQISVYYETLCPDSKRFFLRQLGPSYLKLGRYMDIELVPFGNANVSYPRHDNRPVFKCQHGPEECYGNRVQACVIEQLKNTELALKYIDCMFSHSNWKNTHTTASECAAKLDIDWDKANACTEGSEGERLLIANSLKTFNLNPEHTYIPWIVIDKKHSDDMQKQAEAHLMQYLCENYFNHDPKIPQCAEEALKQFQEQANSSPSNLMVTSSMFIFIIASIVSIVLPSQVF